MRGRSQGAVATLGVQTRVEIHTQDGRVKSTRNGSAHFATLSRTEYALAQPTSRPASNSGGSHAIYTALPAGQMPCESPEGGWGIAGHANTQADIASAARAALAAGG